MKHKESMLCRNTKYFTVVNQTVKGAPILAKFLQIQRHHCSISINRLA
uniref:Uncharacterized protein n=1 Tax=Arundo donax TaxID=35708 RepID=A0A0A9EXV6_ARUDO